MKAVTPYIGFGNETLRLLPDVKPGDEIDCPTCKGKHVLEPARDGSTILMFYRCGPTSYLGALNGKLIVGQKSDVHGEVSL